MSNVVSWGDPRLPERFWDKVSPEPNSGCWLWTAYCAPPNKGRKEGGYGRFNAEPRQPPAFAHRYAYAALVGPIPAGLQLDHLCRIRCCCNPAHLEPVTNAENSRRGRAGEARREWMRARTHCKHGHELTPDNERHWGHNIRCCRECKRLSSEKNNARRRALGIKSPRKRAP